MGRSTLVAAGGEGLVAIQSVVELPIFLLGLMVSLGLDAKPPDQVCHNGNDGNAANDTASNGSCARLALLF